MPDHHDIPPLPTISGHVARPPTPADQVLYDEYQAEAITKLRSAKAFFLVCTDGLDDQNKVEVYSYCWSNEQAHVLESILMTAHDDAADQLRSLADLIDDNT